MMLFWDFFCQFLGREMRVEKSKFKVESKKLYGD